MMFWAILSPTSILYNLCSLVSPVGIVNASPPERIIVNNLGDNVTFQAITDAGPGTLYYWIADPTFTYCIQDSSYVSPSSSGCVKPTGEYN